MPIFKDAPKEINGFNIIKDSLVVKGKRIVTAICKLCKNEFNVSIYNLKRNKSCGCHKPDKFIPLPEYINGFRIVKDLGKVKHSRQAVVECKLCKRHYKSVPWALKDRKHCGCLVRGTIPCSYINSHPRLLRIYMNMKERCYRKKCISYPLYGAKGIKVCNKWLKNSNLFCEWSLKNGYTDCLTIDRIDSNKGYSSENCRWVTITEQARNRKNNKLSIELAEQIRKEKKYMSYKQLSVKYKVSITNLFNIIKNKIWIK